MAGPPALWPFLRRWGWWSTCFPAYSAPASLRASTVTSYWSRLDRPEQLQEPTGGQQIGAPTGQPLGFFGVFAPLADRELLVEHRDVEGLLGRQRTALNRQPQ